VRLPRIVAVAALLLVLGAAPAAADPAKPTDYRSTIDAVEPASDALDVSIVGGDSFLRVQVAPGHTLVVEDYEGSPYLQILDDGTVQENQQSKATYQNVDRYAQIDETVLEGLDPEGPPEWLTIDDDGEYAWHDHRIHWMSPDRPDGAEPGDVIQTVAVPMQLDGEDVAVTVTVRLEHPESVLPWLAGGGVVVAALLAAGWRRGLGALPLAAGAALVAAVLAVVTGRGELAAMPPGTGGSALVVIVPAVGLVASLLAGVLLLRRRRSTAPASVSGSASTAGIAVLAACAALAGWALLRLSVLWKAVLPTDLPANLDRAATALAVAVAVGAAALTIRSGAVTPAPLTDLTDD
jgi:hypothetical protein